MLLSFLRKSGRVADCVCLENRSSARDRGFESYLFRHFINFKNRLNVSFSIEFEMKVNNKVFSLSPLMKTIKSIEIKTKVNRLSKYIFAAGAASTIIGIGAIGQGLLNVIGGGFMAFSGGSQKEVQSLIRPIDVGITLSIVGVTSIVASSILSCITKK